MTDTVQPGQVRRIPKVAMVARRYDDMLYLVIADDPDDSRLAIVVAADGTIHEWDRRDIMMDEMICDV